jgi:hypothetical protein
MQVVILATTGDIRNPSIIREYIADTPVPIMDGESFAGYSGAPHDVATGNIEAMEERLRRRSDAASALSACQKAGPKTVA